MYTWVVFQEAWEPVKRWDPEALIYVTDRVRHWKEVGMVRAENLIRAQALAEIKYPGQLLVRSQVSVDLDK